MKEQPHPKFPHMFVVIRIDDSERFSAIENGISAVSVFSDRENADAEVTRLEGLKPGETSRYRVFITRHKD